MSKQISPFAALTGAEKQIRWLEYQSIRLPFVETQLDAEPEKTEVQPAVAAPKKEAATAMAPERPQPPPEVPRTMPSDYQRSRHSQYDAVIARLKQAELQARRNASQATKQ